MNISNVVLDRDKEVVTYNDTVCSDLSTPVSWSREFNRWVCMAVVPFVLELNRYLKVASLTGLSLENLSIGAPVMIAESKPDQVKQERYQDDSGEDWIDECARTFTREEFRGAMKFLIGKYGRRMGKKDSVKIEVEKMHDYSGRWLEYENKIDSE